MEKQTATDWLLRKKYLGNVEIMAIRKINGLLPKIEKSFVSILWLKYCMTEHKSPLPPSGGQKIDLHNKLENNSLSWPSGKKQRKKEKKNEKDALYHSA